MTGSIFLVTVPAITIRSAWRGEARKSTPKRSRSKRAAPVAIISIAQQARPKVSGQRDLERDQLTTLSSDVVIMLLPRVSSTPIPELLFSKHMRNQREESE